VSTIFAMRQIHDWRGMKEMWARLLRERTGENAQISLTAVKEVDFEVLAWGQLASEENS